MTICAGACCPPSGPLVHVRRVVGWYATGNTSKLVHALDVPQARDTAERLGWLRVRRVGRYRADGTLRPDVVGVEVTAAGLAAVTPHPYSPVGEPNPNVPWADYTPCRTCGDVYHVAVHAAP